jgi:hypothetical protein
MRNLKGICPCSTECPATSEPTLSDHLPASRILALFTRGATLLGALADHLLARASHNGWARGSKARRELGWQSQVSMEEGVRLTAEWVRAEGLLEG